MKLEVGMYVRTSYGKIAKIQTIEPYNEQQCINDCLFSSKFIIASYDIIDLIQAGDYVNGYKVTHRTKSLLGFEDGQDGDWYLSNENIKSIVTKEQFESMSYKVGE